MKKELNHIASIRTGLFAKPRLKGEVVYLQIRHFLSHGILDENLIPELNYQDIGTNHLLEPGDVLFAAKGSNNFAATYRSEYPNAVASSSFFVIRLFDQNILPAFVSWTLNSPQAQDYFKSKARGSAIPSVTKHALGDFLIPIPSLEVQKHILHIDGLRRKESDLYAQLSNLRNQQTQLFLSQYLNDLQ